MSSKKSGNNQVVSAAKAGISERTGRNIDSGKHTTVKKQRSGRTRQDPFFSVWDSELVPLLEKSPSLQALTLLENLQSKYTSGHYPDKMLRTLQRRVKHWRAVFGPEKTVIFRQEHPPGRQGFSDFTKLKGITIIINGKILEHLLYHFRLACSGWSHIKVIQGGESFSALAEGLQEALWRLGGVPFEHRTDSLSAAFKNLNASEREDLTQRYDELCQHYQMIPTRNNRGKGHENGSVESPHGHIKRRIKQALLLRGSNDFESIDEYQTWLYDVVNQHNKRNAKDVIVERASLQPLPARKTVEFTEVCARVSSSSTIDVRRATYTVPSRLEGEHLRIHLYHDRLKCFLGTTHVITLARVYSIGKMTRARNINYRHLVHSLIKKPQAFRFSRLRDDLLPNDHYKKIWAYVEKHRPGKSACQYIVNCLYLAAVYDCEKPLAHAVLKSMEKQQLLSIDALHRRFGKSPQSIPTIEVTQHLLNTYDELYKPMTKESCYA